MEELGEDIEATAGDEFDDRPACEGEFIRWVGDGKVAACHQPEERKRVI